jgi:hypothetical protein
MEEIVAGRVGLSEEATWSGAILQKARNGKVILEREDLAAGHGHPLPGWVPCIGPEQGSSEGDPALNLVMQSQLCHNAHSPLQSSPGAMRQPCPRTSSGSMQWSPAAPGPWPRGCGEQDTWRRLCLWPCLPVGRDKTKQSKPRGKQEGLSAMGSKARRWTGLVTAPAACRGEVTGLGQLCPQHSS